MQRVKKGLAGELVLEPGEHGLAATVIFDRDTLVIETGDGERNEWHRDLVRAVPYDTRTIQLHLDATTLYFNASDPLVFAERFATFESATPQPRRRRSRDTRPEPPDTVDIRQERPVVTRKASRRGRRRDHRHDWASSLVGGGIVRRLCVGCGHLSIDVSDAYEMQGDPNVVKNRRL